MGHDDGRESCCKDWHGCIMAQSIVGLESVQPYKFSDCSKNDYINELRIGQGLCLLNKPNEVRIFLNTTRVHLMVSWYRSLYMPKISVELQASCRPYLWSQKPSYSQQHFYFAVIFCKFELFLQLAASNFEHDISWRIYFNNLNHISIDLNMDLINRTIYSKVTIKRKSVTVAVLARNF